MKKALEIAFANDNLPQAVEEINIVLKNASLPLISEENLARVENLENDPDWFCDSRFVFRYEIEGYEGDLEEKLHSLQFLDWEEISVEEEQEREL